MSCNIYEDPDLIMGNDKGQVEMLVDIYDSAGGSTNCRCDGGRRAPRSLPAGRRNRWPAAGLVLVLVLLCLLMLAACIVLTTLYVVNRRESKGEGYWTGDGNQLAPGWRSFGCRWYYTSNETKNWTDSKMDCRGRGARLVMINSDAENEFMGQLSGAEGSWIGLETIESSLGLVWRWVDNSDLVYTHWKVGVNSQAARQAKAFITSGGLWDHANSSSKRWICEREAGNRTACSLN